VIAVAFHCGISGEAESAAASSDARRLREHSKS